MIKRMICYPEILSEWAPNEKMALEAAIAAQKEGIAEPVLVGSRMEILRILKELGGTVPIGDIYDAPEPAEAAALAVRLVREIQAQFLMKGYLDTSVLLEAVVNKEYGLGLGGLMSHFAAFEVPSYHKLLVIVDGGMVTYPTLEQKKVIIENTVSVLYALGYDCPKVGVVACVEKVNPKMPETVEARELRERNRQGLLTGCMVEGPISYDCAVSREIANTKGFVSEVAKITGIPEIQRESSCHVLNSRAMARKCAESQGRSYGEMRLLVAHLGGRDLGQRPPGRRNCGRDYG